MVNFQLNDDEVRFVLDKIRLAGFLWCWLSETTREKKEQKQLLSKLNLKSR
jgi:hypothetical protein